MYRNPIISKTKTLICTLFIILVSEPLLTSQIPENASSKVSIDGFLDEPIWKDAKKFTNFIQTEPQIFSPSKVKSEFYFAYDSRNIYLGGSLFQDKRTISASNARKDDLKILNGDCAVIAMDPLNNGNSAIFFVLNPVNAQADGVTDAVGNLDFSWDAVFTSFTRIYDDRWTFELKIPLTSISFQNKETQTWGVSFSRIYSFMQETSVYQLIDKNAPYRVSDFFKIVDIKGLKKERKLLFTPYLYGYGNYFKLKDSSIFKGKLGGEIKYNPTPSTTILATFNPDYAQIETDQAIINVSDLPTTYPEKRPFFIESSDMYPHLAVNTRNITDINAGIKYRFVSKLSKLDITTVYDKLENLWGMANYRLTDNSKYHFEVISGIKSEKTNYLKDYNYNVTLHGRLYFFKKRLQVYTLYGSINMPNGKANQFEFLNGAEWNSRTWNGGITNWSKSEYYNPDVVGSPALSNEVITDSWLGYTFYDEKGFFRKTSLTSHVIHYDLFTGKRNGYFENTNELNNQFYLGNKLGNWELVVTYKPKIEQSFRFRDQSQFNSQELFYDAFSPFILITQAANSFLVSFKTDPSKKVGTNFKFDNGLVRKSNANNYSLESFIRIGSKATIAYTYNFLYVTGSDYQNKYRQSIHRLKAEYNITDKMNLRLIFQPNIIELPLDYNKSGNTICNVTCSWEFVPGGNIYIVYNNYRNYTQTEPGSKNFTDNNHMLIIKVLKTF